MKAALMSTELDRLLSPDSAGTTTVRAEWAEALAWRDRFLNNDTEQGITPLDNQLVCYLIADCMTFRALVENLEALRKSLVTS